MQLYIYFTGAARPTPLGLEKSLTLEFAHSEVFPTAFTCSFTLTFPTAFHDDKENYFENFALGFRSNNFFGHV